MLVLSRKPGQSIVVNGDVTITVVSIDRMRVQLGVAAPFHVTVHREEIHQRIQAQESVARELHTAAAL